MSPLPFLFKQQLKYYTSHFGQPLSQKNQLIKHEDKVKPKSPKKPNQPTKKPPQTTQTIMCPFPELYTLVTIASLISSFQIQHLKDT